MVPPQSTSALPAGFLPDSGWKKNMSDLQLSPPNTSATQDGSSAASITGQLQKRGGLTNEVSGHASAGNMADEATIDPDEAMHGIRANGTTTADTVYGASKALSGLTGAVARTVEDRFRDAISVKEFGAKGDGVMDDTAAIQAAINAIKSTVGAVPHDRTRRLFLPSGLYRTTASITLYGGLHLFGEGDQSRLAASSLARGRGIIELAASDSTGYCTMAVVESIGFDSNLAGVWAIRQVTKPVVNCRFEHLFLNTTYGLALDRYAQGCIIDNVYSFGAIDRLLYLKGNFNIVGLIDKEGGTGASSEPYIELSAHSLGGSNGNTLHKILIEGDGSANKVAIRFDGCDAILHSLWVEAAGVRKAVSINASTVTVGRIESGFNSFGVEVGGASNVTFSDLKASDQDVGVNVIPLTLLDQASVVDIPKITTRRFDSYTPNPQVRIGRNVTLQLLSTPVPGLIPAFEANPPLGSNLLTQGSFETAGGWSMPNPTVFSTAEYAPSELGAGNMFHGVMNATASSRKLILQDVAIAGGAVGRRVELAGWAKCTGIGMIAPALAGCGISSATGYSRCFAGDGWVKIRLCGQISSAGPLNVRIWLLGCASGGEIWLDDWCVWLC
jgi:hypothetical protein